MGYEGQIVEDQCGGCGATVWVRLPPEVCDVCGGSGACVEHGWEAPACVPCSGETCI